MILTGENWSTGRKTLYLVQRGWYMNEYGAYVCSQIHTKHINTLCGQNVDLLNVKLAVPFLTSQHLTWPLGYLYLKDERAHPRNASLVPTLPLPGKNCSTARTQSLPV